MSKLKIVLIFLLFLLLIPLFGLGFVYFKYKNIPNLNNKTSILVLGKGGEGHTGPNLTDTIMLVTLNPESSKTTILSLPRDIWVSDIKAKLNTAYHYGGFEMAKSSIKTITARDISNSVVVDFNVFKEIIDTLGGIDVDVENEFVDTKYPIAGRENDLCNGDKTFSCRYETIEFKKGLQKMNGETALKFVRSRNSQGDEGTDLAREKRQQRVILAIKNKVLSPATLTDYKKIKSIYEVVLKNLETDITTQEVLVFSKFMLESKFNLETISIPEELLQVSRNDRKYDFQYVFIPKGGSWKEIQKWVNSKI